MLSSSSFIAVAHRLCRGLVLPVLALTVSTRLTAASERAPAPTLPAAAFFRAPEFTMPKIAPAGNAFAVMSRTRASHYALAGCDLATGNMQMLVREPKLGVIDFGWKTDQHLLVALLDGDGQMILHSVDLAARKSIPLDQTSRERVQAVVSFLPADPSSVICLFSDGTTRRVNVRTGESRHTDRAPLGMTAPIADVNGSLRAGLRYQAGAWALLWRSAPGAAWREQPAGTTRLPTVTPLILGGDERRLIVLQRLPRQPARLAWFDLATGELEAIFQHERFDVNGVRNWGYALEPAGAVYLADRESNHFFVPEAAACYRMLGNALPGAAIDATSFSRDANRIIVLAHEPGEPGTYYLLDRKAGRLEKLSPARPELPTGAATTRTFEFKSRDGALLSATVTTPNGRSRPPLLVRFGPNVIATRTGPGFDAVAQFLAHRGYATARIHTRGTPGFGLEFLRAGDLKLTTTVLDDVDDGVDALVAAGAVDAARIGVFAEQEGGIPGVHAALRGRHRVFINLGMPTELRAHELERLVVSDRTQEELTELAGGRAQALAYVAAVEPLTAVARLQIPSFHFYPPSRAGHDMIDSGRQVKRALEKSGAPHAFHIERRPEPAADMADVVGARYEAIARFLDQHLR